MTNLYSRIQSFQFPEIELLQPMIKPGKLLIDETKADTVEVIKIPKVPPKPPPKTKPLKLARTDNNLKTKPVDQDVSQVNLFKLRVTFLQFQYQFQFY